MLERLGIDERRAALDVADLAHLRDLADAARHLVDDLILERAQLVEIDLRRAVGDAPVRRVMRLAHHFGDMQQRLRRNAAAIEAHAAGIRFEIDERDLHPEIRRIERGGIPPGTGTDDN